jgi:Gram-negative bacterial TonB protein C-terminal
MKEKNTYKIYGHNDIRRYINGEMSSAEMYALEKQSLEDPFLMDAIDGYNNMEAHIADASLAALKTNLQPLQEAKVISLHQNNIAKKFPWLKVGIAASVIGLITIIGFQFLGKNKQEEMALKEPNKNMDNVLSSNTNNTFVKDSLQLNGNTQNVNSTELNSQKITYVKPDDVEKFYYSKQEPISSPATNYDFKQKQEEPLVTAAPVSATKSSDTIFGNSKIEQKDIAKADVEKYNKEAGEIVAAKPIEKEVVERGNNDRDRKLQNANAPITRNATQYNVNNNQNNGTIKFDDLNTSNNQVITYKKREQVPSLNYMFNYRVIDAQGNHIPFSNVSVPADQLVTYSRVDGRFGLFSTDSVLKVNIKAAGYLPQQLNLQNSNTYKNIVLTEMPNTDKALVIGANKNFFANKKSVKLESVVEEVEPIDGYDNYDSYIANNINITEKPKGEVVLAFEVSTAGEATNIVVAQSLGSQADQEAIRLLTNGPKWKAAKKKKSKGKIVIKF